LTFHHLLVHTGQHYDYEMSKVFFEDLQLPKPDIYLGVGSGSHAEQTGRVMIEFEKVIFKEKPDFVVVVGDVNSTLACTLASVKLDVAVAHVEAGLRSFDRTMPEEINRLLTDQISHFLFTPSADANENLRKEGVPEDKIFLVGNVMVDSLLYNLEKSKRSQMLEKLSLIKNQQSLPVRQAGAIPGPCSREQTSLGRNLQSVRPYALLTLTRFI
jgi:UDP-N-acetylglucosamine 2-epimerase (non-hydrolysing)